MLDHVATQIHAARKAAGLSREELAVACGCSLATIVRYETGRTQRIPMATMAKIASATGKPLAFFLETEAAA